jgi:hypothetical protein
MDIVNVAVNRAQNKDRPVPLPDPPCPRFRLGTKDSWKPAPFDDKEPVVQRSPDSQSQSTKKEVPNKPFSHEEVSPALSSGRNKVVIDLSQEEDKNEEDQNEEEVAAISELSSVHESHSSDGDYAPENLPSPVPQLPPLSPPPSRSKPKKHHSARELNIQNLTRKIEWITRFVNGEKFSPPELPDTHGHIDYPNAMTPINLLCVLVREPVTCDLEEMVRAEIAGISQHQVYIELANNQIIPAMTAHQHKFKKQTAAVGQKFLPSFHGHCYAEAEIEARKVISAQYKKNRAAFRESVQNHIDECEEILLQVQFDLEELLPKVETRLNEILNQPPTTTETSDTQTSYSEDSTFN